MRRATAVVVIAGFALHGLPTWAEDSPTWPPPVRVMSFNIRYGTANDGENSWPKRREFLWETIRTFDPDLLGTQETLADQRDFLKEKLSGYGVEAAGRDDGKEAGEMAALFYRLERFERLDSGHFWLCETPDQPGSKGWDAALPRIATWVRLKDKFAPDGKPVLFLNTHFDHRGRRARLESAKLLRRKLESLGQGCRMIVTGDFNAGEGSEPYLAMFGTDGNSSRELLDTFRIYRPTRQNDEGTFNGFRPHAVTGPRIDWIACSPDWWVRQAAIDRTTRDGRVPSDHFPITAVLRAKRDGEKPTLRILSYNIHHGAGTDGRVDLPRIARVIRQADPDIVALQEVDQRVRRSGEVEQTAELARLTGLYGAFGKAIDFQGGEYGQAILSRVRLESTEVHPLPGADGREKRIAFAAALTIDGQALTFVTTHLDHQWKDERLKQIAKLNELFTTVDRPVILAGDFNAVPESDEWRMLSSAWHDTTAGRRLQTFPAPRPTRQLDSIFFRPEKRFHVLHAEAIDEGVASDHRPVLVILSWKDKGP